MSVKIKEITYRYHKDTKDHKPYVTVCVLETEDGRIARGISICSIKETPCKRIGRKISHGRAMKALTYDEALSKSSLDEEKIAKALNRYKVKRLIASSRVVHCGVPLYLMLELTKAGVYSSDEEKHELVKRLLSLEYSDQLEKNRDKDSGVKITIV